MLNYSARRVGLVAAVVGVAVATGACGARQPTGFGEPVILAAPAPRVTSTPPLVVPSQTPEPPARTAPAPDPTRLSEIDPALPENAARRVEPNTTLGAVVFDRVSGATPLSVNADRRFRSASLVKLMIAVDALRRGATEPERRSLARMLSLSDDDIASTFWVKGGRSDVVTRVVSLVGLRGTEPPELPGRWGEVTLTANDVVRLYRYVVDVLPPADHALVVDALAQAPRYAADDFDQHFGIPAGLDTRWAIKQGWGNNDRTMALHSTGLLGTGWRYVVVLLTEHPLGSGWRTSADSVTAAAGALEGRLPGA
jgi:hypothetical protein